MFALESTSTYSQEIKRSRFTATAAPIADMDAAKDFIARNSIPDANHNCWAWRVGQNYRFSDDGEPSGTAGKPILQAIDGQKLDTVAVIVTRWFGGVLLGSGGLIRAYGGTAALCLQAVPYRPIIPMVQASVELQFSDLALVKAKLLAQADARITEERFVETGAILEIAVPEANTEDVIRKVSDLTNGRAVVSVK
ncbi:YigZ family protein [Rhizobium sp. BK376]|uniref:IMPACT family protein n=1 Tax=Rhizobium sp. BK376 TaxID=2512149 RepID=UPI0010430DBC|nr:YigZ family protein [Rhizobium sp. BK376]TCR83822.1 putative YigZ family protein [Rhizobium sp. BK376]